MAVVHFDTSSVCLLFCLHFICLCVCLLDLCVYNQKHVPHLLAHKQTYYTANITLLQQILCKLNLTSGAANNRMFTLTLFFETMKPVSVLTHLHCIMQITCCY